ncbi:N-carbamoyl-L-amino acid hydrolase [Clostridium pasteurianum DSM 525 = ATCC 6013]|uniref:Amidase, hydantoinase/carbamoylase family n=1 Tax=Clostridium pasteurianum DSM 525 = ATCC 6013 TaxID=1262449 RepID=A0A0H3J059_CLOPA|nr:Zn-dependent hydrolase [Clostridium pasteurianum]AJA47206.1 N-carbamoyl-L-amino acid hydrolase [Clostridium pasteurianum DSM 525 = ATCC 6013]AJA51194.1 N-carbamoyl-L-amino acid hydrolase [Clostridium pasteurianum DSM 525 = ATCC 6013]AOZ74560.1 allantoate amidohydrolase [Clostridium pasteurianum DSM 525 = ATCC 6013]AOZ78357.1 allantoate amidohydrolase [Clostridium pasteurianum]ELP59409.1 allantoate amidohydrolase [Clostridium pasteurianum DSM 525 = ATCC 6013]
MENVSCDIKRMEDKIVTFSKFGDTGKGGITRLALSEADFQAREEFCKRMKALGAEIVTDDMGNIYATFKGSEDLPHIAMGSHCDSVVQGGNYDGILGVLTGMEVAETIVKENIPHRHPITVMIWTNEEGARFDPAMMSSGVITGKFDKAKMLASKDMEGVTFGEALDASGYKGDEKNRMNPKDYKAFLELHIEQGPVLEAEKVDIGVVEGVVGMVNYEFEFIGQAGHAGTVPQKMRQDALLAASEAIQYLHRELDKLDEKLVYTTGRIICSPNVHTIIPDDVKFTLDARHQDPEVIKQVVEIIKNIPSELAKCKVSYKELWSRKTVSFNKEFVDFVEKNAETYGYSNMRMYSGPGHDAQFVADMLPVTMIFVPSIGGHSHCEIEKTPVENCLKGANVLLQTVLDIDKK